jgi:hypothetical protein
VKDQISSTGRGRPSRPEPWHHGRQRTRPASTSNFVTVLIETSQTREIELYFAKKGCEVLLQSTPEAISVFNRSQAKKIGLFHVTC